MKKCFLMMLLLGFGHPVFAGVSHTVLVWLKPEVTPEQVQEIITQTKKLTAIPGLSSLRTGYPMDSERKIVDSSFTIGIYMEFPDKETMQRYLVHPDHVSFVESYIKGRATRIQVYDFSHE